MDDEKVKSQIGKNIAAYRKRAGLTQAGLAERISYSDKAISKWERGESVPDVLTLVQLAEQFSVTVNDLLIDPEALPEDTGAVQQAMEKVVEKTLKKKADKGIILKLSALLVWFVALLFYVVLSYFEFADNWNWVFFVYAVPITAIVLLSLRSAWHDFRWNQMLISLIVWGSLLSIYMIIFTLYSYNFWKIFLLGIPGQIAIFLWFRMYRPVKEKKEELPNE